MIHELEELINHIRPDENNRINWVDFIQKFKDSNADHKVLERTRTRLHALKEQMYTFLLSPKDAFVQFNADRTGKLTFDQFLNLMRALSVMTNLP